MNIGLDKPALARLFGGEMPPGCSFLPPGMPGYDEALDTTGVPVGRPELARATRRRPSQMIEDAGVAGDKVTVYGNNDDPTDKVTEAYAEQLNEIGFDAEPEILDGGVYFQTIGNDKTKAQTGFTNWFQDFPHPFNFFFLVDGDTIQPTNNQNYGWVDDPEINDTIDELNARAGPRAAVEQEWADAEPYLVESAAIAPYGHRKLATFRLRSDRFRGDAVPPGVPQRLHRASPSRTASSQSRERRGRREAPPLVSATRADAIDASGIIASGGS